MRASLAQDRLPPGANLHLLPDATNNRKIVLYCPLDGSGSELLQLMGSLQVVRVCALSADPTALASRACNFYSWTPSMRHSTQMLRFDLPVCHGHRRADQPWLYRYPQAQYSLVFTEEIPGLTKAGSLNFEQVQSPFCSICCEGFQPKLPAAEGLLELDRG